MASGLLLSLSPAFAADSPATDAAKPTTKLEIGELTKARENFSIPNPGELLQAASDKIDLKAIIGKIEMPEANAAGTSDAVRAHAVGTLLADGFICLHAKDAKKTRAIGKQLLAISKELGADDLVLAEGKAIGTLVDEEKWNEASTAADTFRTKLLVNLAKDGDADLITIISATGWLHGFGLIADQINAAYNEDASRQLRQSELAAHLGARVAKLPEGRIKDAAKASADLMKIAELSNVAQDAAISKEAIEKIATAAKDGMAALEGIQEKK